MKNASNAVPIWVLFFSMESGRMARSPTYHSHATKVGSNTAKTQNSAMIDLSDHGFVMPPHWRGSSRDVTTAKQSAVPIQSTRAHFCAVVRPTSHGRSRGGRGSSQRTTVRMESAPNCRSCHIMRNPSQESRTGRLTLMSQHDCVKPFVAYYRNTISSSHDR